MPSNYKRLGDYIQEVNVRNRDLSTIPLLGVSIKKILIPSIANIIGTDMSTYKLIQKNQFAYGPVTSRNGDKISIALLEEYDVAMVSQAYTVFEVIDERKLLPEYLMMWFRRPEFDRYARFMSHGSAREIFSWTEMCETRLPVPSLEKQQEIVREYHTIQNRIALNNQLISKLEETAQAIYKQWFVEFEFPFVTSSGVEMPYKSNGGKMVWCEELEKDIPEGWDVKKMEEITNQICVAFVGSVYDFYCEKEVGIPMLRTTNITEYGISYEDLKYVTKSFHEKNKKSKLKKGDLLVARHGSNGMSVIFNETFEANALNVIIIKPNMKLIGSKLINCFLNSKEALEYIQGSIGGSVQEVLNTKKISEMRIVIPDDINISRKLSYILDNLQNNIQIIGKDLMKLEELKDLLLARMTRVN